MKKEPMLNEDIRKEFNKRIKSLKLTEEAKEELFIEFQESFNNGFLCAYCNERMELKWGTELSFTIDHTVPKIKNGKDEPNNLKFVCRTCNFLKGDMDVKIYMDNMKRLKARKNKREYWNARKTSKNDERTRDAFKDIFERRNAKNV